MSEPSPDPQLPPGGRRPIALKALAALTFLSLLAAGPAAWFFHDGQQPVALSLLVGHLTGQVITISWLVAALLTFDKPMSQFMGSTLGLSPARILVVLGILALSASLLELDATSLFAAFVITHVYGQVVEGFTFAALRRASAARQDEEGDGEGSPSPPTPPPQHAS